MSQGDGGDFMINTLLAVTFALIAAAGAEAQQCLHADNDNIAQKERRSDAVAAMRTLNTAEAMSHASGKRFVNFSELAESQVWATLNRSGKLSGIPGTELLPGFELQLTTDGSKYSISLKDKTDPCGFTLYTSDAGIIYTGYPIDFRVTPSK
jgi:hypothetical protein